MTDRLSLAVFTGLPLVGGCKGWCPTHSMNFSKPSPLLPPPEKKNNPRLLKNEDPFQEMIPREKHKYQKLPLICFLTYKQHQKNNGLVYSSRLF